MTSYITSVDVRAAKRKRLRELNHGNLWLYRHPNRSLRQWFRSKPWVNCMRTTSRGNCHLLTMQCNLTKFLLVIPIPNLKVYHCWPAWQTSDLPIWSSKRYLGWQRNQLPIGNRRRTNAAVPDSPSHHIWLPPANQWIKAMPHWWISWGRKRQKSTMIGIISHLSLHLLIIPSSMSVLTLHHLNEERLRLSGRVLDLGLKGCRFESTLYLTEAFFWISFDEEKLWEWEFLTHLQIGGEFDFSEFFKSCEEMREKATKSRVNFSPAEALTYA